MAEQMEEQPLALSDTYVLVVEDSVPNFVLIARMLAYMGVRNCEWKTSGWQVVQFAVASVVLLRHQRWRSPIDVSVSRP